MTEAKGLKAINPATGTIIATYPLMNQEEIIQAIEEAQQKHSIRFPGLKSQQRCLSRMHHPRNGKTDLAIIR